MYSIKVIKEISVKGMPWAIFRVTNIFNTRTSNEMLIPSVIEHSYLIWPPCAWVRFEYFWVVI